MNVQELVQQFDLTVAAGNGGLGREIRGGHCSDLLSEVLANCPVGCIWLTIQVHRNIVAVAVLRDIAAIVLTGGNVPDAKTRELADSEKIPILLSSATSYDLAGWFFAAGIVNTEKPFRS